MVATVAILTRRADNQSREIAMELSNLLYVMLIFLTATTVCVILFNRLGLGSVVGFIVAGVIIGPHTPGFVALSQVDELQSVSEFGVVLFLFAVGLEMQPKQLWAMRRMLFGLGGGQVLLSAAVLSGFVALAYGLHWQSAVIVGLGMAQSSSAVVMTLLANRGEMASVHGRATFATLMAQDMSIVPVMALIPILAHKTAAAGPHESVWIKTLLILGVLAGIVGAGRLILPRALGWAARNRTTGAFGIILFLGVIAAAWAVDRVGISMTLGSFLLGMLLSASDYRYQVAAVVEPYKGVMMGLFFIAVGMSMDVQTLVSDWYRILLLVAAVLTIKVLVMSLLCRAFGISWQGSLRTGFSLSQVGEFAFVLFSATAAAGLLSQRGVVLGYLLISISMVITPLMVKLGDSLARRFKRAPGGALPDLAAQDLKQHLVIIGLDQVGFTISLLAEKAEIPYIAIDRDFDTVRSGQQAGRSVYYGNILSTPVQQRAGLDQALAVFISTTDAERLRAIALSLKQFFPKLKIYARVSTFEEQAYLRSRGIENAGTMFIESTFFRGSELLKDLGVPEDRATQLVESLRKDDYEFVRNALSGAQTVASPPK